MKHVTYIVLLCLAVAGLSSTVIAARGDLLATFKLGGTLFSDPQNHMIYVTDGVKTITAIDTRSLNIVAQINTGERTAPKGMALSADGSKLYVALSGSAQIAVVDTHNLTLGRPLNIPYFPSSLTVGLDGRFYATSAVDGYRAVMQIDGATGATTWITGMSAYNNDFLQISPDRRTLYFGQSSTSPSQLAKLDVSTATASVIWTSPWTTYTNGQGLVLNHSGDAVYFIECGNQRIDRRQTIDMAVTGTMGLGGYPRAFAISPDDRIAYAGHTSGHIDFFDARTCGSLGQFSITGEANYLMTDETGSRLFVNCTGTGSKSGLYVYDTGFAPVPEPSGLVALSSLCAGAFALAKRRRTT